MGRLVFALLLVLVSTWAGAETVYPGEFKKLTIIRPGSTGDVSVMSV
ncbi:hypothetical protein [Methylobacterium nodulans]|uniref:Uncharacterized protein n=1 Tax=Methylobacterium nodulans (strain LMG 21967 / CNCM I-2342 / ORS 2060) TaxID=460265 RepID=B8IWM0_METNO|nr:hypothetical protein [Methylobacterium nodulans]ACL62810.1 hypothetical protein Mnod_8757 [Methylobacterium nodulans ORS 2060]